VNLQWNTNMENTSGRGEQELIPEEIRGWSWGIFLLGWLWGLFNDSYIALLTLIPFAGFIMAIISGLKGNEWAWRNKHRDNIKNLKAGYVSL
jgi:hypothetical protein